MTEDSVFKSPPETPPSPIKGKRIRRTLKKITWGPGNRASDKFWEEKAYGIIRFFGIGGVVILILLVVLSPMLQGISEKELVRNVYYLLIFIGAGIAASIATWRGRQSERQIRQLEQQIQDSRLERQKSSFEKAIDMATDPKSRNRRGSGFRTLRQILFAWGENFEDTPKENIDILNHLVINNFVRTLKQKRAFIKLYEDSKISFGSAEIISSNTLFIKTHKPDINVPALNLWKGIVNWNMRRWGNLDNLAVPGIYSTETTPTGSYHFIFSGVNLRNLQFFVMRSDGKIISSTQRAMPDFKRSCFLLVDMHGATIDHVNFLQSHFNKINLEGKSKENCEMSCIGTNFTEANLIECNFRGANFKDASFIRITALDVIFDEANLTDCQFESADLGGASFVETNISGSDFSQAKNLTKGQFQKGAYWIGSAKPQFPKGWGEDFVYSLTRRA